MKLEFVKKDLIYCEKHCVAYGYCYNFGEYRIPGKFWLFLRHECMDVREYIMDFYIRYGFALCML